MFTFNVNDVGVVCRRTCDLPSDLDTVDCVGCAGGFRGNFKAGIGNPEFNVRIHRDVSRCFEGEVVLRRRASLCCSGRIDCYSCRREQIDVTRHTKRTKDQVLIVLIHTSRGFHVEVSGTACCKWVQHLVD